MESLYVCAFDNGYIKVGRSADPQCRIKQHQDRVSCFGVELSKSQVVQCSGNAAYAEATLIERCAAEAANRNLNEWFAGLEFGTVCEWAASAASITPVHSASAAEGRPNFPNIIRSLKGVGLTQTDLAGFCGCDQSVISELATGRTADPRYSIGSTLIDLYVKRCMRSPTVQQEAP